MVVPPGYPKEATYEGMEVILLQMKKAICKIKIKEMQGTGFFCKIPFPDLNKMLRVLITNNHVINRDLLFQENARISIEIKKENDYKDLYLILVNLLIQILCNIYV